MVQRILYPTDLGIHASLLLGHVMEMAEHHDAEVIAVHAVEPLGVFADAVLETYIPVDMMGDLRSYGLPAVMEAIRQQVIEAFAEEFIDVPSSMDRIRDVCVMRGSPADVILQYAESTSADMIVMGARGPESEYSNLLGSTAAKVLQLSKVPVLMVPLQGSKVQSSGGIHRFAG